MEPMFKPYTVRVDFADETHVIVECASGSDELAVGFAVDTAIERKLMAGQPATYTTAYIV